jgi:hypothetical protein
MRGDKKKRTEGGDKVHYFVSKERLVPQQPFFVAISYNSRRPVVPGY